jgi:hypothetical protein
MADARPNKPFISRVVEFFDATFDNRGKEHSSGVAGMCLEQDLGLSADRSHIIALFRRYKVVTHSLSWFELGIHCKKFGQAG